MTDRNSTSGSMDHASGCVLCGERLIYAATGSVMPCVYCGLPGDTSVSCGQGHYVCDTCHGRPAVDLIETYCIASSETDPVRQALLLMANPAVKMHGPEHHFLVPAVLLSACCNVRGIPDCKSGMIATARKRSADVKGGFCGFHGTCGAAMGAGIAASVLLKATPLHREEWKLCNLMTATCLTAIAMGGGPRCCKRDTFFSLFAAATFLREHLSIDLGVADDIVCTFSDNNKECIGKACRFFPR